MKRLVYILKSIRFSFQGKRNSEKCHKNIFQLIILFWIYFMGSIESVCACLSIMLMR